MNTSRRGFPFNQINYSDGTPSREVEDWEATGKEEMNELYEQCKRERASVVSVRDHLNRIHSMVEVCIIALLNPDYRGQQLIQVKVADVLCDYIGPEIEKAEEELRHV